MVAYSLVMLAATVGRIDSYIRSNNDGSEREAVHVYRATPDRLEVIKTRERCTSAAFVSARLSHDRQYAVALAGGRLLPKAKHNEQAWLRFDPKSQRAEVRIEADGKMLHGELTITTMPWHDYEFDLASLGAAIEAMPNPRQGFSFGLTMIAPGDAGLMKELGRADARFVRAEQRDGRATWRFEVSGPAFANAAGGPLWIDAADQHIVEARWGLPNHEGYRDFVLRETGRSYGVRAWQALQRAHFAGCAPKRK